MHTNIWSIDLSSFFYFQKPNLAVTFIIVIKFVHYTVQRKTNLIMKWTEPALVFTWLTHIQKYYHLNDKKFCVSAAHCFWNDQKKTAGSCYEDCKCKSCEGCTRYFSSEKLIYYFNIFTTCIFVFLLKSAIAQLLRKCKLSLINCIKSHNINMCIKFSWF